MVQQGKKKLMTDVWFDIICRTDAVKTSILQSTFSAGQRMDYSCASATLWLHDRNERSAFKVLSLLLRLNKYQTKGPKINICM